MDHEKKYPPACLALSDGSLYWGYGFGVERGVEDAAIGEVVFNTSMFGYQEITTDPSYAGQIMCFTNPHIGNVGCNDQDVESPKVHVEGVIIRELSKRVSNFRAQQSLHEYLKSEGKTGIAGIDTRELVIKLRASGVQMGAIACGQGIDSAALIDKAKSLNYDDIDYVSQVSCKEPYAWLELPWDLSSGSYRRLKENDLWSRPHVVALDCGIKYNILRLLLASGFRVTVAPANTNAEGIMELHPDAVFLSNGPGNPETCVTQVEMVKQIIGKVPMFGICLGHQIMALAFGAKTFKLKFGHRGGNHPVRDETTSKVEITVQNHGFAVDSSSVPPGASVTHINLNDQTVEGMEFPDKKAFCIQYHPESSPGPHDASYLFQRFFELVINAQTN